MSVLKNSLTHNYNFFIDINFHITGLWTCFASNPAKLTGVLRQFSIQF